MTLIFSGNEECLADCDDTELDKVYSKYLGKANENAAKADNDKVVEDAVVENKTKFRNAFTENFRYHYIEMYYFSKILSNVPRSIIIAVYNPV